MRAQSLSDVFRGEYSLFCGARSLPSEVDSRCEEVPHMITMLRVTAIAWTLLVFPAIVISQAQPNVTFAPVVKGLVLQDVECSEFHSRFTGHDYHVYVSLPASYRQGDRRYPVLYVPDLEEGFLLVKGANDL